MLFQVYKHTEIIDRLPHYNYIFFSTFGVTHAVHKNLAEAAGKTELCRFGLASQNRIRYKSFSHLL